MKKVISIACYAGSMYIVLHFSYFYLLKQMSAILSAFF